MSSSDSLPSIVRQLLSHAAPVGVVTYLVLVILERIFPGLVSLFFDTETLLPWVGLLVAGSYLFPPTSSATEPIRRQLPQLGIATVALLLSIYGTYRLLPHGLLTPVPKNLQMLFAAILMITLFWLTAVWYGLDQTSSKNK